MTASELKLRIMELLLPYYDMFQAGEMADDLIAEYRATGATVFYVKTGLIDQMEIVLTEANEVKR